jgi:hypothetical protein
VIKLAKHHTEIADMPQVVPLHPLKSGFELKIDGVISQL